MSFRKGLRLFPPSCSQSGDRFFQNTTAPFVKYSVNSFATLLCFSLQGQILCHLNVVFFFHTFSAREDSDSIGLATKRFSGHKKPITLEFIKGTLLVVADQMVGTISDVIQENAELEKGNDSI